MNNPWPGDSYLKILNKRINRIRSIKNDPQLKIGANEYYRDKPIEFINDWLVTYDPRNTGNKDKPVIMPFILFPRQQELVQFIYNCLLEKESGLVEKSRDMGATWVACGFSVWAWLFLDGSSIGWGSRKEQLVDKLGDPDSIFEKIRILIEYLPRFFWPEGFSFQKHVSYMKIINPENGSTITGEAGDNIGRGGRKSIYFKDESAHYERPEKIEAALGDNTDVQIDFSSVNGTGNVFHRRRKNGKIWDPERALPTGIVRIFILDWRDHPNKTQEWYDKRREKAEREGLLHIFHQEVDRDYSSSKQGILIPGIWVKSAVNAHMKLGFKATGKIYGALDVYDEGADAHAFVARKGSVLFKAEQWYNGDVGDATRKTITYCKLNKVRSLQFDANGIGAGVKSETNRLKKDDNLPKNLHVQAWLAGSKVRFPKGHIIPNDKESPKNEDFYLNLRAQGAWQLRNRFEKTHKAVVKGESFDPDEMISISSDIPCLQQLEDELSQPTYSENSNGKLIIDKAPDGAKSPNLFDSTVMAFWPIEPISRIINIPSPGGIKNELVESI